MKAEEQLAELERIAKTEGVSVRYETMTGLLQGAGGLCRVRSEYRIIMDRRLKADERVQVIARALAGFPAALEQMPREVRRELGLGQPVRRRPDKNGGGERVGPVVPPE